MRSTCPWSMVGVTTPEPAEAPGGADRADPSFEMPLGDNSCTCPPVDASGLQLIPHACPTHGRDRFEEAPYGEPFTVERLRGMVGSLRPEIREHSTVLWAADEIERLRAEVAFLERLVMNVAVRCVRDPEVAEDMVADEREQMRS